MPSVKQAEKKVLRDFVLSRNSALSCRSFNDAESQLGGFPLEVLDLSALVFSLVKGRSSVHVFIP